MANVVTTQVLVDGARNLVVKVTGVLDTSNVTSTVIVDPATLVPVPTQLRIDCLEFMVSDPLSVLLKWDATAPVDIAPVTGFGKLQFRQFGGLQNNAGAGKNGKILLSTVGWAAGIETFTVILHMVKQGV